MRFVKAFLVGITGLFIITTLLSLLIPGNVQVVRNVIVNNSKQAVKTQVTQLNQWKNWHPAFNNSAAAVSYLSATTCDILYHQKTTHLTITKSDTSSLQFSLSTQGENNVTNQISFDSLPGTGGIQVQWSSVTKMHWYPWEKFYAIFLDKITGPGYEAALNGLKNYLEK